MTHDGDLTLNKPYLHENPRSLHIPSDEIEEVYWEEINNKVGVLAEIGQAR